MFSFLNNEFEFYAIRHLCLEVQLCNAEWISRTYWIVIWILRYCDSYSLWSWRGDLNWNWATERLEFLWLLFKRTFASYSLRFLCATVPMMGEKSTTNYAGWLHAQISHRTRTKSDIIRHATRTIQLLPFDFSIIKKQKELILITDLNQISQVYWLSDWSIDY